LRIYKKASDYARQRGIYQEGAAIGIASGEKSTNSIYGLTFQLGQHGLECGHTFIAIGKRRNQSFPSYYSACLSSTQRCGSDVSSDMIPNSFFTNASFVSLAGSSAIVFVVCNALQAAFNFNPRWLAFTVSELIAVYGVWASGNVHVPSDFFVAVLNGCLIFVTASGGANIGSAARQAGQPRGRIDTAGKRRFLTPWF
jgi:hypothetical protein